MKELPATRLIVHLIRSLPIILLLCLCARAADLRLGLVGTDTSHVMAFTQLLNDAASPEHVPGARVVAAYKGGSPDVHLSAASVDKYAEELRTRWNVTIVPDIATLCGRVDGVLLTSVDGRVHLEQARKIIAARKPVFIDKPLASTLEDAREIAQLAAEARVPWFTSSGLRYTEIVTKLKSADASGATVWGPGPIEEHHYLDMAWYGIHAVETLYALLGTGCDDVTRISTPGSDVVVGRWKDGRIGSVRTLRPYGKYGAVVFRPNAVTLSDPDAAIGYRPLVVEIVKFFQTGTAPIPPAESLEIFSFMDAAQRSKAAGGVPTRLR